VASVLFSSTNVEPQTKNVEQNLEANGNDIKILKDAFSRIFRIHFVKLEEKGEYKC